MRTPKTLITKPEPIDTQSKGWLLPIRLLAPDIN